MEGSRGETESFMSKVRRQTMAFGASLRERFEYIKASFLGQVRRIKAKNEQEATQADMQTAKIQVEAADAAEAKKKQLGM